MALQYFSISAGAFNDQTDGDGNNYIPGVIIEIQNLNGTLASIFSDEAGTTPITQDGVSNATGANGTFSFFIGSGNYKAVSGGNEYPFGVGQNEDHSILINRDSENSHPASAISRGVSDVDSDLTSIEEAQQNIIETVSSSVNSDLSKGDILKKVKDKTTIRGMYFRKQSSTDFRVGLGLGGVSDAIVEYRFFKNDDGLILLRGGYSGREDLSLATDNTAVTTGVFNEGSAPETYTTEVGAKVNGSFSGDCFHFISRKDDRGGLWKLTLTNSFGFVREANISTYSDTTESPVTQKVFENLDFGDYSYELEFMGDDPNNPPSTTARGWIYYRPTQNQYPVRFLTVAPIDSSSASDILTANSIPDFAIKARVSPNTSDTEWVPQHGAVSGVSSSQLIKIILDGIELSGTNIIPDINYQKIKNFELIQSFDAVNPLEPSTTLWEHYVSHSISTTSPYCSIANRCEFVSDTYCAQIYFAMLPSDADNADRLVLSQGLEVDSIPTDGSEINFNQESESAMYSGLYSASITHAAICRVNGLKDSLNWGTEFQEEISGRTTFRADGITKCYWNAGAGVTVPAGTVMRSNHDIMVVTGVRTPDTLLRTI